MITLLVATISGSYVVCLLDFRELWLGCGFQQLIFGGSWTAQTYAGDRRRVGGGGIGDSGRRAQGRQISNEQEAVLDLPQQYCANFGVFNLVLIVIVRV